MWLYAYRHLVSKFLIEKQQVPVPCSEYVSGRRELNKQHSPTRDTSDVCIHITTYDIKSGTSTILFKVMSASHYL